MTHFSPRSLLASACILAGLGIAPAAAQDLTIGMASEATSLDPHFFNHKDDQLCVLALQMMADLDFLKQYKITLDMAYQYILTVRKNYRTVAYHNFAHALSVTHAFYILVLRGKLSAVFSHAQLFVIFLASAL